jgi:ABC-2 type transport system ATP-binding protein
MRVELRNVWKRFGAQVVLRDVNLSLERGARVALVGPNGSGKSTLLRTIMGLLRCEGEVLLDGRSPFRHRDDTAQQLAYVPQAAPQLAATVDAVVGAIADLRSLQRSEIARFGAELGLELASIQEKPFRALSGGMKHKLLIALAFASRPSLYILDEPTASLDVAARSRFVELLHESAKNATVIVCSHRLEEVAELVQGVVELGEGRIVRHLDVIERPLGTGRGQGALR